VAVWDEIKWESGTPVKGKRDRRSNVSNINNTAKKRRAIIKRNLHKLIVWGVITSFCILGITAVLYMGVHRLIRSATVKLDKQVNRESHPGGLEGSFVNTA